MKKRDDARPVALGALLLAAGSAWAAGGHHAVDDAEILEPQQCELEAWFSRARGGERGLHAGANCRVGPVELGVASEYARFEGESQTAWGIEAKWATEVAPGFSLGAKAGPAWAAHVRPRHQGASASALATWKARDSVALHANLGRDFVHRGEDQSRYGAAVEWAPAPAWSLMAERYKEEGTHFVRGGVRFLGGGNWSVDLSRSHRLSGPAPSAWTLGGTWSLARR